MIAAIMTETITFYYHRVTADLNHDRTNEHGQQGFRRTRVPFPSDGTDTSTGNGNGSPFAATGTPIRDDVVAKNTVQEWCTPVFGTDSV